MYSIALFYSSYCFGYTGMLRRKREKRNGFVAKIAIHPSHHVFFAVKKHAREFPMYEQHRTFIYQTGTARCQREERGAKTGRNGEKKKERNSSHKGRKKRSPSFWNSIPIRKKRDWKRTLLLHPLCSLGYTRCQAKPKPMQTGFPLLFLLQPFFLP